MQITSGPIFTNQDFLSTGADDVVRCFIAYVFKNQHNIGEVVLPWPNCPIADTLTLELPVQLWRRQQKCPFSNLLPWIEDVPPDWVHTRIQYRSSNTCLAHFAPEYMLFGHFDPTEHVFRVEDTTHVLPEADILIRRQYGTTFYYHGATPQDDSQGNPRDDSQNNLQGDPRDDSQDNLRIDPQIAIIQQLPVNDHSTVKGIEYCIITHPLSSSNHIEKSQPPG